MAYLKATFIYFLIPVLFYPIYFIVANSVDSLVGNQQFMNWLQFESKTLLIKTILSDWVAALPIMFGLYYFMIVPVKLLAAKLNFKHPLIIALACVLLICVLSVILGFRNLGLITNGLSVFMFVLFYIASLKLSTKLLS